MPYFDWLQEGHIHVRCKGTTTDLFFAVHTQRFDFLHGPLIIVFSRWVFGSLARSLGQVICLLDYGADGRKELLRLGHDERLGCSEGARIEMER